MFECHMLPPAMTNEQNVTFYPNDPAETELLLGFLRQLSETEQKTESIDEIKSNFFSHAKEFAHILLSTVCFLREQPKGDISVQEQVSKILQLLKTMLEFYVKVGRKIEANETGQAETPLSVYDSLVATNYYKQELLFPQGQGLLDAHLFENLGRLFGEQGVDSVQFASAQDDQFSSLLLAINDEAHQLLTDISPDLDDATLTRLPCQDSLILENSVNAKILDAEMQKQNLVIARLVSVSSALRQRFNLTEDDLFVVEVLNTDAVTKFGPHSPTMRTHYCFNRQTNKFTQLVSRVAAGGNSPKILEEQSLLNEIQERQQNFFKQLLLTGERVTQERSIVYQQFIKKFMSVKEGFAVLTQRAETH